jgi:hypothetical protein
MFPVGISRRTRKRWLRLGAIVRIERHALGPRVHVFGRRIHEYECGTAVLAGAPFGPLAGSELVSLWTIAPLLVGLWLVVKDWPDLFPATRDKASWRLGVHRLPTRVTAPGLARQSRTAAPASRGRSASSTA